MNHENPHEQPFDLDITMVETTDPASLVTMTDDGCGSTCQGSTCISSV
ncbi:MULTISPECIES: FxLD family lanthipeptide [Streptomyces]|nr:MULTISPECIES: FxLD family lanthipeptide [Streptomyces]